MSEKEPKPRRRKSRSSTQAELLAECMAKLPHDRNGAIDKKQLHDELKLRVESQFDADAAIDAMVDRMIENATRPGKTEPDGQLKFDGMDAYDYEPNRLVLGPDQSIVENRKAKPTHKAAEARRTQDNAVKVQLQANRRQQEASLYSEWFVEQILAGRPKTELTFGVFVKETKTHQPPQEPEPEVGPIS